jgi:hypothetical protein
MEPIDFAIVKKLLITRSLNVLLLDIFGVLWYVLLI